MPRLTPKGENKDIGTRAFVSMIPGPLSGVRLQRTTSEWSPTEAIASETHEKEVLCFPDLAVPEDLQFERKFRQVQSESQGKEG